MMLPAPAAPAPAVVKIKRAQLENDLAAANAQIIIEKNNVINAQGQLGTVTLKLRAAETNVNALQADLQTLSNLLTTKQQKVKVEEKKVYDLNLQLRQAQNDLGVVKNAMGIEVQKVTDAEKLLAAEKLNLLQVQQDLGAAKFELATERQNVQAEQANVQAARQQVAAKQQAVDIANALVVTAGVNLQAAQGRLAAANQQVLVEQGNAAAIQLLLDTANNDLLAANARVVVEQGNVATIQALLNTANNNLAAVQAQLVNTQTFRAEYSQFAAVVRPVVALAAGAATVYTLYHNPVMIGEGIALLNRTVGTEMTFDGFNAMLGGYGTSIARLVDGLTGYATGSWVAPAVIYASLKLVNAILLIPGLLMKGGYKLMELAVKPLIYVLGKANEHRTATTTVVLGLALVCTAAYYVPSLNSMVSPYSAKMLEVLSSTFKAKYAEMAEMAANTTQYAQEQLPLIVEDYSDWAKAGGVTEVLSAVWNYVSTNASHYGPKFVEVIGNVLSFIVSNSIHYGFELLKMLGSLISATYTAISTNQHVVASFESLGNFMNYIVVELYKLSLQALKY